MKFVYPAIIYRDDDMYVAEFPDLEGCRTYANTIEETITNASEALAGYLETLLECNIAFNKASKLENISTEDGIINYIYCDIDLAKYSKSVKKTLTIPAWLNDKALEKGINFSKVLQSALYELID